MKLNRKWIAPLCILFMLAVSAVVYPSLPQEVPAHYNISGEVDYTLANWQIIIVMPIVGLLIWVLLVNLPKIDPRRAAYAKFDETYNALCDAIMIFLIGLHVLLITQYDNPMMLIKLVFLGAAALIIYIGNQSPRFRQTWFVGIRTPWTLMNEEVWRKTQRVGGRFLVVTGLFNILATLVLPVSTAIIVFILSLLVAVLGISLYSYTVFRNIEGQEA